MNTILKTIILCPLFLFLFLSCTKDDATSISLTEQAISLKAGQSDTLNVTINYTGEQAKVGVTVTVSDNTIASATILPTQKETKQSSSTFSRSVVIKAISKGSTSVVIQAGSKKITCPTTITQTTLLMNQSVVMNYGLAVETSDNNVFIMDFFPETFTLNQSSGSVSGSGQFIHFESFFPASVSSITAGTYPVNLNGAKNTFLPGGTTVENGQSNPYGTYMVTIENNQVTYTLIKSGQYTVSFRGSTVDIEGDLTTETDEIVHFSYFGPVTVVDKTEKPEVVNTQFTKGELYYVGDYYNMSLSHTFFAYLETANVDLNSETLDGEVLIVQFDTYDYYSTSIPGGSYTVLTQEQLANFAVKPYTIVPGNFHYSLGKQVTGGSWYYNSTSRKRFISGKADVSNLSGQYIIQYSFYDRIGSLVTGTYTGTLKFTSEVSSAPRLKTSAQKVSNTDGFPSAVKQQTKTFGAIHEKQFRFIGAR